MKTKLLTLLILSALIYWSCTKEDEPIIPSFERTLPEDLPNDICPLPDTLVYQVNLRSAGIDISIGKYVAFGQNGYLFNKGDEVITFTFIQNNNPGDANNAIIANTNYGLFSPNFEDIDLLDSDGLECEAFQLDIPGYGFAFRQFNYIVPDTNIYQIFFQSDFIVANEADQVESNNSRRASIAVIN